MGRRLAVLVRDRQEEALRVAAGLTLCGNRVEVYVLDRPVRRTPAAAAYLDALRQAGGLVGTACAGDGDFDLLTNAEIARRVLACDHILAY